MRRTENQSNNNPDRPGLTVKHSVRRGLCIVGLQLSGLILVTMLFAAFDLDRLIAALFFDPAKRWYLAKEWPWLTLYRYGTLPGALLAIGCVVAWMISFFKRRIADWRPYFALVVLTTVVAGGILVNSIFKPYWGRPRPNQVTDFGGYYTYQHVFPPGLPGKGASFPCGHCTMGFTFLSLYFIRRKSPMLAWSGVAAGIILGGLLSAARIVQGAHFMTDVLWSLGMVTMTAVALYYCILKIPTVRAPRGSPSMTTRAKVALIVTTCLAVLAITGAFMTRRPFYKTRTFRPPLGIETSRIDIELNVETEQLLVRYTDGAKAKLLIHAHGFGWAYVDYQIAKRYSQSDGRLRLQFQILANSYFSELDHSLELLLPRHFEDRLDIQVHSDPKLVLGKPVD